MFKCIYERDAVVCCTCGWQPLQQIGYIHLAAETSVTVHLSGVPSHLAHKLVSLSGKVGGGDHPLVSTIVHSVSLGHSVHEARHDHVTSQVAKSSSPSDVSLNSLV